MADLDKSDRLERERSFHNLRFAQESERKQEKYYFAIEQGEARFMKRRNELAVGKDVLEYGCSTGDNALLLSEISRSIVGIDISEVAIDRAGARVAEFGISNASFFAMNAEKMKFADASFDLIFGSGIIHHLDTERSAEEILRVLRPGGRALFWEPLGHNQLINFYRQVTPGARTSDEHPLLEADLRLLSSIFKGIKCEYYGLSTLALVPFQKVPGAIAMRRVLNAVDQAVFSIGPLWRSAWFVAIELEA